MKKFKLLMAILCIALSLTSCKYSSFDTDTILIPPQMNAVNQEIQKALTSVVGGSYELVYPKSGNYTNAVISTDITGDGVNEAVCFYTSGQDKKVSFTVLKKKDGNWTAQSMSQSLSAAIDRVDFFDYDSDGTKEIIVGWQYLLGDEKALEIFSLTGGKSIESLYTSLYNNLIVFDDTLVTISRNTTGKTASASLVGKSGSSVAVLGTAALSNTMSGLISVQSAKINDDYNAIFIDEQLESAAFTTEILVINKKGDISNVSTQLATLTTRNTPIICTDVNGDGTPDIPVEKAFPSYIIEDKTENLYYIEWYGVTENDVSHLLNAYTSTNEQFLLTLPDEWIDNITVQKDASSDRQIHFYMTGDEGNIPMFSLRVFSQQEFSEETRNLGWLAITEYNENVYAFKSYSSELPEAFSVDASRFTELFKIMS